MTTFVLLHGFTGVPRSWDLVVDRLPPRFTVLRPCLGGHAGTSASSASFVDEVDRIARIVSEKNHAGNHLVGYSLGGRLALGLLVRHPALWATATLVGAHPGLGDEQRASRIESDEHWARMLEREGLESFLRAWEALPLWSTQRRLPPEVEQEQRAWRREHEPSGLAWSLRTLGLGKMPSWRDRLSDLAIPVTFAAGARDEKFTKLAEWMASKTPRGRHCLIHDCGHNVVLERPHALGALLQEVADPVTRPRDDSKFEQLS